MANKKITDATTITSMATTDKVFVNSGSDIKQIPLQTLLSLKVLMTDTDFTTLWKEITSA